MTLFKIIRILLLLLLFAFVAFYAKTQKLKSRSWSEPLEVVIFPINGDNSPIVEEYINNLTESVFSSIDHFMQRESQKYSIITSKPTKTRLGTILKQRPPAAPLPGSDFITIAWWGLKLRYWAFKNTPDTESNLHRIRVFVHYHEAQQGRRLQHSLGLDKGLLAIVHAFASIDQDESNNIVIVHELLHTVGASDKYGENNEPIFPIGYANPNQHPLYPQSMAEIMAARIPTSANTSFMPNSLDKCVIGQKTAKEINWLQ